MKPYTGRPFHFAAYMHTSFCYGGGVSNWKAEQTGVRRRAVYKKKIVIRQLQRGENPVIKRPSRYKNKMFLFSSIDKLKHFRHYLFVQSNPAKSNVYGSSLEKTLDGTVRQALSADESEKPSILLSPATCSVKPPFPCL